MIRPLALLVAITVSLGAQSAPLPADYQPSQNPTRPAEQYPGQHDHAVPPDDFFCMPVHPQIDQQPDHPCSCKRMAQRYADGSCVLNEDGTEHVVEDPRCAVYCHMAHCKCGTIACDT